MPLKKSIWIPPPAPPVFVGTQTVNEAVADAAINLINELFCNPKQLPKPDPAQSCTELPNVLPHNPLKSQMVVAEAQDELEGNVVEHPGNVGGKGAGLLLNVKLQFDKVPAFDAVLLSWIQSLQLPFAFCPLFTDPK